MEYSSSGIWGFLTPAVIVAALAYLIRFFGKTMCGQKPFSDDKDWEIEFSGFFFFLNFVVTPGVIGYLAARYLGSFGAGHWIHLLIVLLLGGWILFTTLFLFEKMYQVNLPEVGVLKRLKEDPMRRKIFDMLAWLNVRTPQWWSSIVLTYVGVLEWQSGSIPWIIFIGASILFALIFMAANLSLINNPPPKADICLLGGQDAMRNLTLLKVNENSIKLRDEEKIVILNRAQVLKIEIKMDRGTEVVTGAIHDSLSKK